MTWAEWIAMPLSEPGKFGPKREFWCLTVGIETCTSVFNRTSTCSCGWNRLLRGPKPEDTDNDEITDEECVSGVSEESLNDDPTHSQISPRTSPLRSTARC